MGEVLLEKIDVLGWLHHRTKIENPQPQRPPAEEER
jgi:hypothetical protein